MSENPDSERPISPMLRNIVIGGCIAMCAIDAYIAKLVVDDANKRTRRRVQNIRILQAEEKDNFRPLIFGKDGPEVPQEKPQAVDQECL